VANPTVRRQTKYVPLTKEQFRQRFFARFYDPAFDTVKSELEKVFAKVWDGYIVYRKSPRETRRSRIRQMRNSSCRSDGSTPAPLQAAESARDRKSASRVLIVNSSTRGKQLSVRFQNPPFGAAGAKDHRILRGFEVDFLDISTLSDRPCKLFSHARRVFTAQPSVIGHALLSQSRHGPGQRLDEKIYPLGGRHGVMILCPVHWYQAPASLKLMIDRLVCADGGNPDPTTTKGKNPLLAKQLELKGWSYPKHLAGRAFSVIAHGDAAGPENLRRMLTDWLTDMEMVPAGPTALIDTWVGWYQPYATSHDDLDKD
jgi:hypothetical protein